MAESGVVKWKKVQDYLGRPGVATRRGELEACIWEPDPEDDPPKRYFWQVGRYANGGDWELQSQGEARQRRTAVEQALMALKHVEERANA